MRDEEWMQNYLGSAMCFITDCQETIRSRILKKEDLDDIVRWSDDALNELKEVKRVAMEMMEEK